MDTDTRLALSYYKEIASLSQDHNVFLVQHRESGRILVKKELTVYDPLIYRQLKIHPVRNTPRIYELYESENILFIIEEYITGESLEVLLEEQGSLPAGRVCQYIESLCDILTDLHSRRPPIIHRDIKPSNIIITPSNELFLLDFNAARNYKATKSEDTNLLGTRGYAAPEQYGFGESSERTDLYAVGVLMKALLTWSGQADNTLPESLDKIISTCTKLDPAERYSSAAELKHALKTLQLSDVLSKSTSSHPEKASFRKRFLPPGFRSGKPVYMILMSLLYLFILSMAFSMKPKDCPPEFLMLERTCFCTGLLLMVFFSGNYLEIQNKCRLSGIKKSWLRIILIAVIDFSILLIAAFIAAIIEAIAGT